jgi:hypothetical protein
MNKTHLLIGVVVLVVLVFGVYGLVAKKGVVKEVREVVYQQIGAAPGPNIQSECLKVNGVETCYKTMAFNTASTTRCAIQSPTSATSTLSREGVVKSATTTDYTLILAKSATPFATTTTIRNETVTGDALQAFPTASTTYNALADTDRTFKPGEWLVVKANGTTATAFAGGSTCSAMFTIGS